MDPATSNQRTILPTNGPSLNIDNINPNVRSATYAVRGDLAILAEGYRIKLTQKDHDLPFRDVIAANVGNPQQFGQKPITFYRQVISLVENPSLLQHEDLLLKHLEYKSDAIARAKWLLEHAGTVGAYSASAGVTVIRESVSSFIARRDGFPADPNHIYLTSGAGGALNVLLQLICHDSQSGVLLPMPHYPLYTARLTLLNANYVSYHLDEDSGWRTNIQDIKSSYEAATVRDINVRAIIVVNPGNPAGALLTDEDIKSIIDFANEKRLVIIADEVYQANIFEGNFVSFKSTLRKMQMETSEKYDHMELASMHSISKGTAGKCGQRGGYFETVGFDPEVEANILKLVSIDLCAPVVGQCLVELMVNPPKPGDASHELFHEESQAILKALEDRAGLLWQAFSRMEGVTCSKPVASMYVFPTITVPARATAVAASQGLKLDEFYCLQLLQETGVCVIPGSGFGQKEGVWHFRSTFLPPGVEWIDRIVQFHAKFMETYR